MIGTIPPATNLLPDFAALGEHRPLRTGRKRKCQDIECSDRILRSDDAFLLEEDRQRTLLQAVKTGLLRTVKLVMETRPLLNPDLSLIEVTGRSPLHQAVLSGHEKIALALLRQGSTTNTADDEGNLVLHEAISKGLSTDLIRAILENGFDINQLDGSGQSALHLAMKFQRYNLIEGLFHHDANINCVNHPDKNTPLHIVARYGDLEAIKLLLDKNANPQMVNSDDDTPFDIAVRGQHLKAAKLLVSSGADCRAEKCKSANRYKFAIFDENNKIRLKNTRDSEEETSRHSQNPVPLKVIARRASWPDGIPEQYEIERYDVKHL